MIQYYSFDTNSVIKIYQCKKCKCDLSFNNPCKECGFDNIKNQFDKFDLEECGAKTIEPDEVNWHSDSPYIDSPEKPEKYHCDSHLDVNQSIPIPVYRKVKKGTAQKGLNIKFKTLYLDEE